MVFEDWRLKYTIKIYDIGSNEQRIYSIYNINYTYTKIIKYNKLLYKKLLNIRVTFKLMLEWDNKIDLNF